MLKRSATLIALLLLSCSAALAQSPDAVVEAFNRSISERDIEAALAHLAQDAVQFNLHAAHADLDPGETALTQDLGALWRVVATVLFSSLHDYRREAAVIDTRIEGDIATVWTRTTTRTQRKAEIPATALTFTETYLLFRRQAGWKIAAVANNRPAEPTQGGNP